MLRPDLNSFNSDLQNCRKVRLLGVNNDTAELAEEPDLAVSITHATFSAK